MDSWAKGIDAITLFVEDLAATKQFYLDVFGLPIHYEDDSSAVFRFGDTLVNLLSASEAPDLIAPAAVAPPEAGSECSSPSPSTTWTPCAPSCRGHTWNDIQAKSKSKSANAPALLHGEPDLTVRVIRDVFNEDFAKLVVSR